MNRYCYFLALSASTLLSVQAATVKIDFGCTDSTTTGMLNIEYKTQLPVSLDTMPGTVSLDWSKVSEPDIKGGGYSTTKKDGDESLWKGPFQGEMPFSLEESLRDGLLTQTSNGSGFFTVTFSGLKAGVYSLSIFGGYTGKDAFSFQTWAIEDADASEANWEKFLTNVDGSWYKDASVKGSEIKNFHSFNDNADGEKSYQNNAGQVVVKSMNKGLYATVQNIKVGSDGKLTFKMKGESTSSYGQTALNYLSLTQQVPEPATAALSLLGAAALFLRRRRD